DRVGPLGDAADRAPAHETLVVRCVRRTLAQPPNGRLKVVEARRTDIGTEALVATLPLAQDPRGSPATAEKIEHLLSLLGARGDFPSRLFRKQESAAEDGFARVELSLGDLFSRLARRAMRRSDHRSDVV